MPLKLFLNLKNQNQTQSHGSETCPTGGAKCAKLEPSFDILQL